MLDARSIIIKCPAINLPQFQIMKDFIYCDQIPLKLLKEIHFGNDGCVKHFFK